MQEPNNRFKRRSALLFSCLAVIVFGALWRANVINPWRLYRQARVLLHLHPQAALDRVESSLNHKAFISFSRGNRAIDDEQKVAKIVEVLKRLGPYEDPIADIHYSVGQQPESWRKSDELQITTWDGRNVLASTDFHVFACSPRDRDAIREIIGDPGQYGITDNFQMLGDR